MNKRTLHNCTCSARATFINRTGYKVYIGLRSNMAAYVGGGTSQAGRPLGLGGGVNIDNVLDAWLHIRSYILISGCTVQCLVSISNSKSICSMLVADSRATTIAQAAHSPPDCSSCMQRNGRCIVRTHRRQTYFIH